MRRRTGIGPTDLYSPFGMVLVGETLYIANSNAVVVVPYHHGLWLLTTSAT